MNNGCVRPVEVKEFTTGARYFGFLQNEIKYEYILDGLSINVEMT